jgi:hypothetical protein
MARNMVGTPPTMPQRSAAIASSEASGSNHSEGKTMVAP